MNRFSVDGMASHLRPPPNVDTMTPQQQAEYVNRPEHWEFRSEVQDMKLALSILKTPYGMATVNTIADGILSGQPAIMLERDEGKRPSPEFEKKLNNEYQPFLREALTNLIAFGFVPIKIHPDDVQNFKIPMIPPLEDSAYHIVQNIFTGKLTIKRYDKNNQKYDEAVEFYIESLPSVSGELTSRASALFEDYKLVMTRYATATALDRRAAASELFVRKRVIDDNSERIVDSSRRNVFNTQQEAEPTRTQSVQSQIAELTHNREMAPSQIQSFTVFGPAGPMVVNQLPSDTETVNASTHQRRSEDLFKTLEMFRSSLTSVVGISPSMFDDKALVHGKGLEEQHERTNEIVEHWAKYARDIAQKAYDMSYETENEQELRNYLAEFFRMKQTTTRANQLQLLMQIQRESMLTPEIAEQVFAATTEQLMQQHFVTDAEYRKMVYSQKVRVVISYNLRVSVERIYHLMDMGTVDEETAHSMVLRSLRLDNDVMGITHNARMGVRNNDRFGSRTTTTSTARRNQAERSSRGRTDKKNERRRRDSDMPSSSDSTR
ncbi:MAG: hypothetical protein CMP20_15340 [Rickettsiales bacterium]|nr:hypothetical protein [Rickettsiales bacterium]